MLMRENKGFFSSAFDSAHVKHGVSRWPQCLVVVICCRVKLRHLLEWSSLYRVTLLLSKINDDSDLDAEAAILYGKVSHAINVSLVLRKIMAHSYTAISKKVAPVIRDA